MCAAVLLTLQAVWAGMGHAMQHYPSAWGHYDVCKSEVYTEAGVTWDYMACQPEATDMTKYVKVTLDPPNVTCGDPPETYCTLEEEILASQHVDVKKHVQASTQNPSLITQGIMGQEMPTQDRISDLQKLHSGLRGHEKGCQGSLLARFFYRV